MYIHKKTVYGQSQTRRDSSRWRRRRRVVVSFRLQWALLHYRQPILDDTVFLLFYFFFKTRWEIAPISGEAWNRSPLQFYKIGKSCVVLFFFLFPPPSSRKWWNILLIAHHAARHAAAVASSINLYETFQCDRSSFLKDNYVRTYIHKAFPVHEHRLQRNCVK